MARKLITAEQREHIIRLCQGGMARNDIAREVGLSGSSISKVAHEAGLSFDRSEIAAAIDARTIDLAQRRVVLAERFADECSQLLDQLHQPFVSFNFGGKDNTYEERTFDRPTVDAQFNLVKAAATASRASMDLTKFDTGANVAAGESVLDQLFAGLAGVVDALDVPAHGAIDPEGD